jgi:hypothetical protein
MVTDHGEHVRFRSLEVYDLLVYTKSRLTNEDKRHKLRCASHQTPVIGRKCGKLSNQYRTQEGVYR